MNMKDMMKSVLENQEFNDRREAQLEKIYEDEKCRLGSNNNPNNSSSPFIHVSNQAPMYAENNITLTDDQFREFIRNIKSLIK